LSHRSEYEGKSRKGRFHSKGKKSKGKSVEAGEDNEKKEELIA
jgi:hypothetical protein